MRTLLTSPCETGVWVLCRGDRDVMDVEGRQEAHSVENSVKIGPGNVDFPTSLSCTS